MPTTLIWLIHKLLLWLLYMPCQFFLCLLLSHAATWYTIELFCCYELLFVICLCRLFHSQKSCTQKAHINASSSCLITFPNILTLMMTDFADCISHSILLVLSLLLLLLLFSLRPVFDDAATKLLCESYFSFVYFFFALSQSVWSFPFTLATHTLNNVAKQS